MIICQNMGTPGTMTIMVEKRMEEMNTHSGE